MNRTLRNGGIKPLAIILLIGISLAYFFRWLTDSFSFDYLSEPWIFFYHNPLIACATLLLVPFSLFFAIPWIKEEFRKQMRTEDLSWILCICYGICLTPLFYHLLLIKWCWISPVIIRNQVLLFESCGHKIDWWSALVSLLIPLAFFNVYQYLRNKTSNKLRDFSDAQFAPGSVGQGDDHLGFSDSAKLTVKRIENLKEPVNVVFLFGDMGAGKSSYTRMIIEGLNPEKTLYTYISLTETNEASDFSKLFVERWFATIKNRYPKFNLSILQDAHSLLKDIFRENDKWGILLQIFFKLPKLSLAKTASVIKDKFYKPEEKFIKSEVASYFANVPSFIENRWVIVIDEAERAKLSEVYRAIEVIERVKYLGRKGLPIQIIFLLNISRRDLELKLPGNGSSKSETEQVELGLLVKDFLFDNPKNADAILSLPLTPRKQRIKFIAKQIKDLFHEFDFIKHKHQASLETGTNDFEPSFESIPASESAVKDFFSNHAEAYSYFISKHLYYETPRVILRLIDQARFLIQGFRTIDDAINTERIRFSDLLVIAYIAVKYPAIIDYFLATVESHLSSEDLGDKAEPLTTNKKWSENFAERRASETGSRGQGGVPATPEDRLFEKFVALTKSDYPKDTVLDLIGLVAHFYIIDARRGSSYQESYHPDIVYTSSDPINLWDLLRSHSGQPTPSLVNYSHYLRHQADLNYPLEINELDQLVEYAGYYRNNISLRLGTAHLAIAEALAKAILSNKIPLHVERGSFHRSLLDGATYEFIFNLSEGVLKEQKIIDKACSLLADVLKRKDISLETKIQILRAFMHPRDGQTNAKLVQSFQIMITDPKNSSLLKEAVQIAIDEIHTRYLKDENVIYEREENPIYVLYQGWSGNPEAHEEIQLIRTAAKRSLENYPNIIRVYWDRYGYNPDWQNWDDALKASESSLREALLKETNIALTLATKDLIEATLKSNVDEDLKNKARFWKQAPDDFFKITPSDDTLIVALQKHPLLTKSEQPKTDPQLLLG